MFDTILKIAQQNEMVMLCCLIVVCIDTILGVLKAIKNDDFNFTSNGFRKCLPKFIEYISIIILGIILEATFNIKLTLTFSIIIIITELISIKENLTSIPLINKLLSNVISTISTNYGIETEDVIPEEPEVVEDTEQISFDE